MTVRIRRIEYACKFFMKAMLICWCHVQILLIFEECVIVYLLWSGILLVFGGTH